MNEYVLIMVQVLILAACAVLFFKARSIAQTQTAGLKPGEILELQTALNEMMDELQDMATRANEQLKESTERALELNREMEQRLEAGRELAAQLEAKTPASPAPSAATHGGDERQPLDREVVVEISRRGELGHGELELLKRLERWQHN